MPSGIDYPDRINADCRPRISGSATPNATDNRAPHGAGTTRMQRCSFFVFAAVSRQAPTTAELSTVNLAAAMSTFQAFWSCAFIKAFPASQRLPCDVGR
jgi:hypothetical protein